MTWPSPQDYNEAIQNPPSCFDDDELRRGQPELDRFGFPKVTSGAFASVYRLKCGKKNWAVRCFLHPLTDQAARYAELKQALEKTNCPYTVEFDFLEKGILIQGVWYPLLKMEWVDGCTLSTFLEECQPGTLISNLFDKDVMERMSTDFASMIDFLSSNGIVHGDLQHGNIMVVDNKLKLVDYDGMYVEGMSEFPQMELGHRNYQHPSRGHQHRGMNLDRFSAWTIHTSLLCVQTAPELWHQVHAGDECLLFRHTDYASPQTSLTFATLEHKGIPEIWHTARKLRYLLGFGIDELPPLGEALEIPDHFPPMPHPEQVPRPKENEHWLSTWVSHDDDNRNVVVLAVAESSLFSQATAAPHIVRSEAPKLTINTSTPRQLPARRQQQSPPPQRSTPPPASMPRSTSISHLVNKHAWAEPPDNLAERLLKLVLTAGAVALTGTLTVAFGLFVMATFDVGGVRSEGMPWYKYSRVGPPVSSVNETERDLPEPAGMKEYYRGFELMYEGDYRQAQNKLSIAFKLLSNQPADSPLEAGIPAKCANALGKTSEMMGRIKEARIYYVKALSLIPTSDWPDYGQTVLQNIARVDMQLGNFKEARTHLERALRANGESVPAAESIYTDLEKTYLALGMKKEASAIRKTWMKSYVIDRE